MEDKKFPWLLRLLSVNSSCVHMLDTFAVHKEKIISSFTNDSNYTLIHKSGKSLPQSSIFPLLETISIQTQVSNPPQLKHLFFLYKSQRKEIAQSLLKSFTTHKKAVPPVSYIQTSKASLKSEVKWELEYIKTGYKSIIKPETVSLSILEQAKEISKVLISLIELHENKKVFKISLEFLLDTSFKLILSYMPLCILVPKELLGSFTKKPNDTFYCKSNELSDIVNELSSPSKILKRKPSIIRTIDRKNSYIEKIEIDSPILHQNHNSNDSLSSSDSSSADHISGKPAKIDKNFLEVLCKTRIIQNSRIKKYFISENEIKDEKEKIVGIIEERKKRGKIGAETALGHRNSVEFIAPDKKKSKTKTLQLGRMASKRSGSLEELALPVLSHRTLKTIKNFKKLLKSN